MSISDSFEFFAVIVFVQVRVRSQRELAKGYLNFFLCSLFGYTQAVVMILNTHLQQTLMLFGGTKKKSTEAKKK
jgi:hypothetical protein